MPISQSKSRRPQYFYSGGGSHTSDDERPRRWTSRPRALLSPGSGISHRADVVSTQGFSDRGRGRLRSGMSIPLRRKGQNLTSSKNFRDNSKVSTVLRRPRGPDTERKQTGCLTNKGKTEVTSGKPVPVVATTMSTTERDRSKRDLS